MTATPPPTRIPVWSFLTITQLSGQIRWDKIFLFSQDFETKQTSILLLLSSAYKARAVSDYAREQALMTIHFGTALGEVGVFSILTEMSD